MGGQRETANQKRNIKHAFVPPPYKQLRYKKMIWIPKWLKLIIKIMLMSEKEINEELDNIRGGYKDIDDD
jgi:hypothetical protein